MGLSVAIAGGIILSVLMLVMMSMTGLAGNMFSIGETSSRVFELEKSISETEISGDHLSSIIGSPKVNFTLNNVGSEILWNFQDFDLIIEYDGDTSGKLVEELSFSGDCLGVSPSAGNWCIQSIAGDLKDPGLLNTGERASIWTQVSENLDISDVIVLVSTDNGVLASVTTTSCLLCYQILWSVVSDRDRNEWGGKTAALEEYDGDDNWRTKINLTDLLQWRLVHHSLNGDGTPDCVIGVQYSTDGGNNWWGLDNGVADTLSTNTNSCDAEGNFVSGWTDLDATSQADVWLRIAGTGGDNGNVDFGTIQVQFRS